MASYNKGEKNPKSSVTDEVAIQIKKMAKRGYKRKDIAKLFDLPLSTVLNISTRGYKHLDRKVK